MKHKPVEPRHLPHLTSAECVTKYPRLARSIGWTKIASRGESGCCLRDYRDGFNSSCEAISWNGQTPLDAIEAGIRCRHVARREHRRYLRALKGEEQ